MDNLAQLKESFSRYINSLANEEEARELLAHIEAGKNEQEILNIIEQYLSTPVPERVATNTRLKSIVQESYTELLTKINPVKPETVKLWPRIGIAAAVIGLAIGVYFFTAPNPPRHPELVSGSPNYANDIKPGGNNATLTIDNGKPMQLSQAQNTVVVGDDIKYNDGTTIDPSALGLTDGDSRTLEVAALRGGIYSIILQDGTKAWLNAASKLKFLSNYRNKLQRIVKLEGQAYFEVAKDAKRPFIVESNGQQTEVLGTHFDISAYPGESIKTTLLEGSVKVSSFRGTEKSLGHATSRDLSYRRDDGNGNDVGIKNVVLKPNQQSTMLLSPSGRDGEVREGNITVKTVNAADIIDWKNGEFIFKGEDIRSIMNRVAKWYDIEVIYNGPVPTEGFNGIVSRNKNISQVLQMLEQTNAVHFKIEGRKVTVSK